MAYDAVSGGLPGLSVYVALTQTHERPNVWLAFIISHAVVCVLTLAVTLWQMLITSRLKLNFRTLTIALICVAVCLRMLSLVDPCAWEGIFSPTIAVLLLRAPQAISLLALVFVVAMWRRLVTASETLHRITSRVTIGHYKHTLVAIAVTLAAAVAVDTLAAEGMIPRVAAQSIVRVVFGGLVLALVVGGAIAASQFHAFLVRSFGGAAPSGPARPIAATAPRQSTTNVGSQARTYTGRSWLTRKYEGALFAVLGRSTLRSTRTMTATSVARTRSRRTGNTAAAVADQAGASQPPSSTPQLPDATVGNTALDAPAPSAAAPPQQGAMNVSRAVRARVHVGMLCALTLGWAAVFIWQMMLAEVSPTVWLAGMWYTQLLEQAACWTVLGTVWLKPTRKARGIPSNRAARRLRNWAYQALLAAKLKGVSWGPDGDAEAAPGAKRYKEVWEDEDLVRAARLRQAADAGHAPDGPSAANDTIADTSNNLPARTAQRRVGPSDSQPNHLERRDQILQERDLQRLVIERQARELARIAAEREAMARTERMAVRAALELSRQTAVEGQAGSHAVVSNPLRVVPATEQANVGMPQRTSRRANITPPPDTPPGARLGQNAYRHRVLAEMAARTECPSPLSPSLILPSNLPAAEPIGPDENSLEAEMRRVGLASPPADRMSSSLSLGSWEDRYSPEASPSTLVDRIMFGESPTTEVFEARAEAVARALRELGNHSPPRAADEALRVASGRATPSALLNVATLALGPPDVTQSPAAALRNIGISAADAAVMQSIIRENAHDLVHAAANVTAAARRMYPGWDGGDVRDGVPQSAPPHTTVIANPLHDRRVASGSSRESELPSDFLEWLTHEWPRSHADSSDGSLPHAAAEPPNVWPGAQAPVPLTARVPAAARALALAAFPASPSHGAPAIGSTFELAGSLPTALTTRAATPTTSMRPMTYLSPAARGMLAAARQDHTGVEMPTRFPAHSVGAASALQSFVVAAPTGISASVLRPQSMQPTTLLGARAAAAAASSGGTQRPLLLTSRGSARAVVRTRPSA